MSESTALPGKKALYCEVYKAHFHDPDECDHYSPTGAKRESQIQVK